LLLTFRGYIVFVQELLRFPEQSFYLILIVLYFCCILKAHMWNVEVVNGRELLSTIFSMLLNGWVG